MPATNHHFRSINIIGGVSYPDTTTDNKYFPVTLNGDELVRWYWRVRKWSLSILMSASAGGNTAQYSDGIITTSPATAEIDYAFGQRHDLFFPFTEPAGTMIDPAGSCLMFQGGPNGIAYQQVDTNSYKPYLLISGQVTAFDLEDEENLAILRFSTVPEFAGEDPEFNLSSIAGEVFPLYYVETVSGTGTTNAIGITLTPAEYWPYESATGSPIYNTSTGAQLQSPLN